MKKVEEGIRKIEERQEMTQGKIFQKIVESHMRLEKMIEKK